MSMQVLENYLSSNQHFNVNETVNKICKMLKNSKSKLDILKRSLLTIIKLSPQQQNT